MKTNGYLSLTGDMATAVREGRKTQTRRPMRVPCSPDEISYWDICGDEAIPVTVYGDDGSCWDDGTPVEPIKLKHKAGDILWVREPGKMVEVVSWKSGSKYKPTGDLLPNLPLVRVEYADGEVSGPISYPKRLKWQPRCGHGIPNGIFREAARTFIEITGVRVDRLRDISEADAKAEGVDPAICMPGDKLSYVAGFYWLWESIYKNWNANPWVAVYEFNRKEQE